MLRTMKVPPLHKGDRLEMKWTGMLWLRFAATGFVGFVLAGHAGAQDLEPIHFEEYLNPEVRVSGTTRAGVLLDALDAPASLDRLLVLLPEKLPATRLCLSLVSRSGRYTARLEFELPESAQGFVQLSYPTRFQRELLRDDAPYLTALASLKQDCDAVDANLVPVAWRLTETVARLDVIINAGTHDARVAVPAADGSVRRFGCQRIEAANNVAFNRICAIELDAELILSEARIERDDFFDNPLPDVSLPLRF